MPDPLRYRNGVFEHQAFNLLQTREIASSPAFKPKGGEVLDDSARKLTHDLMGRA